MVLCGIFRRRAEQLQAESQRLAGDLHGVQRGRWLREVLGRDPGDESFGVGAAQLGSGDGRTHRLLLQRCCCCIYYD